MDDELVSVLIPVYNRQKFVCEAIDSALNQTYKNIEVIIVDNCSTDNTYDICKKYENKDARVKVFKNDVNIGPVKNWIKCLEKANGRYSKIIFSDDWIDNNYIEECVKNMKDDIAFIFSKAYIHIEDQNKELVSYKLDNNDKVVKKNFL